MACLLEQTPEERGGALQCHEEGCELRLVEVAGCAVTDVYTPAVDCILQLRLRARGTEDFVGEDLGDRINRELREAIIEKTVELWEGKE